jgi:hypothetical protein
MNKFVNLKKRGVTLPPGCKDLIDLLRHSTKTMTEKTIYARENTDAVPQCFIITRNEMATGVLLDVDKYVGMAFESDAVSFTLEITPPGGRLVVGVVHMEGREPWVALTFPPDPEEERAVRDFFTHRGLLVPEDSGTSPSFFPNLPMKHVYSISPLPRDAAVVSALIADVLRQCCRLTDDMPISFHIQEASDAA